MLGVRDGLQRPKRADAAHGNLDFWEYEAARLFRIHAVGGQMKFRFRCAENFKHMPHPDKISPAIEITEKKFLDWIETHNAKIIAEPLNW